ncbi:hypothetical protein [Streptomyces sp. NPDC093261]|uniref:hypothetical protein n=1 Tax=Streptomyces sp. NPDC093261 TaxID=3366037 RepID=UPI003817B16F
MNENQRVYTPRGKSAHLLTPLGSPNAQDAALCGLVPPWPGNWLGTGSQREHDRAAQLPVCRRCAQVATASQPSTSPKGKTA